MVAAICLAYFGVTLTLSYQFGVEKARTTMLLLVAGLAMLLFAGFKTGLLNSHALVQIDADPLAWGLGLGAVCAAVYLICWAVSAAIYRKKEL